MPYHAVELVDVVAELVREVRAMRAEIAELRQSPATDGQDELLRAVRLAMGGSVFSAAGLLARALAADPQAALLRAHLGGRSVRSVGKLLSAASGVMTADGLVLRKVGKERDGGTWHCDFHSRKGAEIGCARPPLDEDD
jgi:hypothetical protein